MLIKGGAEDRQKCGALLNACAGLCLLLAALVEPFMPSVTRKVSPALRLILHIVPLMSGIPSSLWGLPSMASCIIL